MTDTLTANPNQRKNLLRSIAIAEGASTAVALGSVLAMQRFPAPFEPAYKRAEQILRPFISRKFDESETAYAQRLHDDAAMAVKGVAMAGVGLVSHVPLQLALEGKFNAKDCKLAVLGKSSGLAVAMGALYAAEKLFPQIFNRMDEVARHDIGSYLPQGQDQGRSETSEFVRLALLDVTSSLISSTINYQITKRYR